MSPEGEACLTVAFVLILLGTIFAGMALVYR